MDDFEFIARYDIADNWKTKFMCFVAKLVGGHVVSPLGRIVLLPKDYHATASESGVSVPW